MLAEFLDSDWCARAGYDLVPLAPKRKQVTQLFIRIFDARNCIAHFVAEKVTKSSS